jgi:ABC-2 type transport system ATP-binding protein
MYLYGVDVGPDVEVVVSGRTGRVREVINYLPEEPPLSPYLTGMENILFFARLYGLPESEARSRGLELAEKLGIRDAVNKRVSRYSRGMRQKLAVAVTLLAPKPIYILDEPTTGLDPIARRELLGLLVEEAGESTILFNTHIGQDAEAAERVAFLSGGRVIAVGSPRELKSRFVEGIVVQVKIPFRSRRFEEELRKISVGGVVTVTAEGYRVYVEDEGAVDRVRMVGEGLGLDVKAYVGEPSLEDAYNIAVRRYGEGS